MEKNIYISTILKKRIILRPEYINKNYIKNIEETLKYEVGDKCIQEGYVKKDTINLIKRSVAKVLSNNFTASLAIDIIYSADVCNPVRGNIISCTIVRINKIGLQAENSPLSIIVAKQYHNNKDLFKNLEIGNKIEVLVIGKRYSLNDNVIEIVGKLANDKMTSKKIKIKKATKKVQEEITDIFEEQPTEESEEIEKSEESEENEESEELSNIEEENQEEETEEQEDENADIYSDIVEEDEDEDVSEDDMLETDIEEEEIDDYE